jgi:hypothetical protein
MNRAAAAQLTAAVAEWCASLRPVNQRPHPLAGDMHVPSLYVVLHTCRQHYLVLSWIGFVSRHVSTLLFGEVVVLASL